MTRVYTVAYGLDETCTFEVLDQAIIFTLGLTAKGEGFSVSPEERTDD